MRSNLLSCRLKGTAIIIVFIIRWFPFLSMNVLVIFPVFMPQFSLFVWKRNKNNFLVIRQDDFSNNLYRFCLIIRYSNWWFSTDSFKPTTVLQVSLLCASRILRYLAQSIAFFRKRSHFIAWFQSVARISSKCLTFAQRIFSFFKRNRPWRCPCFRDKMKLDNQN